MLFHTGQRQLFPLVREAICSVLPIERLRYIGLSHFEADECGALNLLLAAAPEAVPVCGQVAAMVSIGDFADRAPRALADGEELPLGRHTMRWFDTPHMPHSWECGLMMDVTTRTFFCGDLFTQGGRGRGRADRVGHPRARARRFERRWITSRTRRRHARHSRAACAASSPTTLACMHGSAWRGDGAGCCASCPWR